MELKFISESNQFEEAAREYREIWYAEGKNILNAFKGVTGLGFVEVEKDVIVYEGVSTSGRSGMPMKLRASYPIDVKKGTLVHELGHRLIAPLKNRLGGLDEHQHLNLFLYDVWFKLWGKDFADKMVIVESARKGNYDYESAWKWFFSLSQDQKTSLWKSFLNMNELISYV